MPLSAKRFSYFSSALPRAASPSRPKHWLKHSRENRQSPSSSSREAVGVKGFVPYAVDFSTYYDNNIGGTLTLCEVMRDCGCKNIVFSSSATVYGMHNVSPLKETMPAGGTTNPYGTTKYMIEIILEDILQGGQ